MKRLQDIRGKRQGEAKPEYSEGGLGGAGELYGATSLARPVRRATLQVVVGSPRPARRRSPTAFRSRNGCTRGNAERPASRRVPGPSGVRKRLAGSRKRPSRGSRSAARRSRSAVANRGSASSVARVPRGARRSARSSGTSRRPRRTEPPDSSPDPGRLPRLRFLVSLLLRTGRNGLLPAATGLGGDHDARHPRILHSLGVRGRPARGPPPGMVDPLGSALIAMDFERLIRSSAIKRNRWLLWLALALAATAAWRLSRIEGLIRPIRVAGPSMSPTLWGPHQQVHCEECGLEYRVHAPVTRTLRCFGCGQLGIQVSKSTDPGDRVLIDRAAYLLTPPKRNDLVAIRMPAGGLQTKRLIGLPGEIVHIDPQGQLVVDDQPLRMSPDDSWERSILVYDDPSPQGPPVRDGRSSQTVGSSTITSTSTIPAAMISTTPIQAVQRSLEPDRGSATTIRPTPASAARRSRWKICNWPRRCTLPSPRGWRSASPRRASLNGRRSIWLPVSTRSASRKSALRSGICPPTDHRATPLQRAPLQRAPTTAAHGNSPTANAPESTPRGHSPSVSAAGEQSIDSGSAARCGSTRRGGTRSDGGRGFGCRRVAIS